MQLYRFYGRVFVYNEFLKHVSALGLQSTRESVILLLHTSIEQPYAPNDKDEVLIQTRARLSLTKLHLKRGQRRHMTTMSNNDDAIEAQGMRNSIFIKMCSCALKRCIRFKCKPVPVGKCTKKCAIWCSSYNKCFVKTYIKAAGLGT